MAALEALAVIDNCSTSTATRPTSPSPRCSHGITEPVRTFHTGSDAGVHLTERSSSPPEPIATRNLRSGGFSAPKQRSKLPFDLTELSTAQQAPNYPQPMAPGRYTTVSCRVPVHPRPRGDGA